MKIVLKVLPGNTVTGIEREIDKLTQKYTDIEFIIIPGYVFDVVHVEE